MLQIKCADAPSCKLFTLEKFVMDESEIAIQFSDCDSCYKFVNFWKKKFIPHVNLTSGKYEKPGASTSYRKEIVADIITTPRRTAPSSSESAATVPQGRKRSRITPSIGTKKRNLSTFSSCVDDADLDKYIQQQHIGKLPVLRM